MKLLQVLLGAVFPAIMAMAGAASASVVSVSGTSGPWDPTIAGNPAYGVGDQDAPTVVAVNAGDNITITYLSGLTSSFAGVPPTVDALGYVGAIFGSGANCGGSPCTGIGSSGTFFPSHAIDPANTGPQIALNALIGDFVNSSGVILDEFATGDGPFTITAPNGAVALQLGVNDDIFNTNFGRVPQDNSGALRIDVTGSTAIAVVPEPATWTIILVALGGLGVARRNSRRKQAAATA
jgi:hypothetical protein